jgi:alkanesulfonate monooxygenase SsuD/methylene tetrahydromethanopterin reductase-like flavin-dependent oxidoreductase (luciferase family)
MNLGAFLMPSHPPERSVRGGISWDLEEIERLDDYGFAEAWIGEHFTSEWEPCPAPDLLIAQALQRTHKIRLGPLGHLLPYHNPIELAHRVAYLDHMAEGRYQLGVGVSALPTDHQLFSIESNSGQNRRMTFESIAIMTSLWNDGANAFEGEFWRTGKPHDVFPSLGYHLRPFQDPHPPIAIAGLTAGSVNHKLAGEKGFIPVSLCISPDDSQTAKHWDAVLEGAARTGRKPDRAEWRIIRDVYVAPTDQEARDQAIAGMMGRCWKEFLLPLYLNLGLGEMLKASPEMRDSEIDLEYLADKLWLVGSPTTVAKRIQQLQAGTGGFGYLLITSYDATEERDFWIESIRLLTESVMPACNGLEPLEVVVR